jgi:hypothetical protein
VNLNLPFHTTYHVSPQCNRQSYKVRYAAANTSSALVWSAIAGSDGDRIKLVTKLDW